MKPISQQNGFLKQVAMTVLVILLVLLVLSFPVFFEAVMMGISAVGEQRRAWNKRCSDNSSRLELIESMVSQGDWKFATELGEIPKDKRVRLLVSERYLNQLISDDPRVNEQLEELSEYRYCRSAHTKINIESFGREIDVLVAVYDGSVLHDCTDLYLWQQLADDLIKKQYWESITSQPYKDSFDPILELKVTPKFTYNPRTGERIDWVRYSKYESLVTRIGACTGHRSDFLHDEGRFRSDRQNVDSDLEWVRANPSPDW